jgi:hypothetical protein
MKETRKETSKYSIHKSSKNGEYAKYSKSLSSYTYPYFHSVYRNVYSPPRKRGTLSSDETFDERYKNEIHLRAAEGSIEETHRYRPQSVLENRSDQKKKKKKEDSSDKKARNQNKRRKDKSSSDTPSSSNRSDEEVVWLEKSETVTQAIPGPMPIVVPSLDERDGK